MQDGSITPHTLPMHAMTFNDNNSGTESYAFTSKEAWEVGSFSPPSWLGDT